MATQGKQQSSARASVPTQKRRPSPAVYRRRRLVVLIGLLVVVALLIAGVSAIGRALAGGSEPQAVSTPPATTAATPVSTPSAGTASPSASPTPVCDFNLMTVAAKTDKPAYAAEELPMLTMTITNGGSAPCEVNVGTSQMEYLIMSGADRIFSSKDCQTGGVDLIKTIQPGKSETANFPWQRNRTLEGCGAITAKPGAGGAYYTFEARLGNKASPKAVFQLN
ncbi:hypothetical protein ACIPY2_17130 [Paenarthrobacter sp. NPDC089675]|uniref:hypothetical protein n=1 Tax=Paenarthrobacter sp. NPDC089675 TaxID=3364376 RepID=UPI003819B52E